MFRPCNCAAIRLKEYGFFYVRTVLEKAEINDLRGKMKNGVQLVLQECLLRVIINAYKIKKQYAESWCPFESKGDRTKGARR